MPWHFLKNAFFEKYLIFQKLPNKILKKGRQNFQIFLGKSPPPLEKFLDPRLQVSIKIIWGRCEAEIRIIATQLDLSKWMKKVMPANNRMQKMRAARKPFQNLSTKPALSVKYFTLKNAEELSLVEEQSLLAFFSKF